jgi:hypothetical protein
MVPKINNKKRERVGMKNINQSRRVQK